MDHSLIPVLPVKTVIKNHPFRQLLLGVDVPGCGRGGKGVEKRRVCECMADVWWAEFQKEGGEKREELNLPQEGGKRENKASFSKLSQSYNHNFWVPHKRAPPYHYSKEKTRLWNQKSALGEVGEEKGKEACKWDRIYPEIITLAVIAGLLVNTGWTI